MTNRSASLTPTSPDAQPWHDAGPSHALDAGAVRLVRTAGHRLAVGRTGDGALFAIDDACPHEGYPLSKGWLTGCALTCPWHNFKFDVQDGRCLKGDEDVLAHGVREHDGRIEVQLRLPEAAVAIEKRWKSLAMGVSQRRIGQISRDIARLLTLGVSAERIAAEAARLDAVHAEYGMTHAPAVAADLIPLLPRFSGLSAIQPLLLAFEQAADANTRLPPRQTFAAAELAHGTTPEETLERLRDAVEAEDVQLAEGLMRAALDQGWDRSVIEPWLVRLSAEHFVDFGHAMIYATKVFTVIEAAGPDASEVAAAVLPAWVVNLVNGTREDVLPQWATMRDALAAATPKLADWNDRCRHDPVAAGPLFRAFYLALESGDRKASFAALADLLDGGGALFGVTDVLIAVASVRMLRYDLSIESNDLVQENWLDVTHTLTFCWAVAEALQGCDHADALKLLWQATRFVANAAVLDGTEPDVAIDAPVEVLRDRWQDACIHNQDIARPIVLSHLFKTVTAACEAHEAMAGRAPKPMVQLPLKAAQRLMDSPVRQRRSTRLAHEAIRLVRDGKVPKTLT